MEESEPKKPKMESEFKVIETDWCFQIQFGSQTAVLEIDKMCSKENEIIVKWDVSSCGKNGDYQHESSYNTLVSKKSFQKWIELMTQSPECLKERGVRCAMMEEKTIFWMGESGSWCVVGKENWRFGFMSYKDSDSRCRDFYTRCFITIPHKLFDDFNANVLPKFGLFLQKVLQKVPK